METRQRQHSCQAGLCRPGGIFLPQGALLEAFCFPTGVTPPVLAPIAFSLAYSPLPPAWGDIQQQVQVTHLFLTWSRKDLITNSNLQGPLASPYSHIQQSMEQSTAAGTLTPTYRDLKPGTPGKGWPAGSNQPILHHQGSQLQKRGLGVPSGCKEQVVGPEGQDGHAAGALACFLIILSGP